MTDTPVARTSTERGTWTCGYICRECGHHGTVQVDKGRRFNADQECPNCGNRHCLLSQGAPKSREPRFSMSARERCDESMSIDPAQYCKDKQGDEYGSY